MKVTNTSFLSKSWGIALLSISLWFVAGCTKNKKQQAPQSDVNNQQMNMPMHGANPMAMIGRANPAEEVKKGSDGSFDVSWSVLREYDLSTKKLTNNLKKVIGSDVTVKGFMVPLDYSAKKISEFLLVPYMPSCMHVPPPPPNMTIHVKTKGSDGIQPSYYPVEVRGRLRLSKAKPSADPMAPSGVYLLLSTGLKELKY